MRRRVFFFEFLFCLSHTPSTCRNCTALAFSPDLTWTVMTHFHHVLHSPFVSVEDALETMKLLGAKGADSPRVRTNEEQIENSEKLTSAESTLYRSLAMKLAYVAQDRVDIGEAVFYFYFFCFSYVFLFNFLFFILFVIFLFFLYLFFYFIFSFLFLLF